MKFVYCFDLELKNRLINSGFKLIPSSNKDVFIFENNQSLKFNFSNIDNSKYVFTNKMIF